MYQRRFFFRQLSLFTHRRQQSICIVLAFLHVRLVEGIDAEDSARGGGGNFPAYEFLPQIPKILQLNGDHRLACFTQQDHTALQHLIRGVLHAEVDENPILSVNGWLAKRLTSYRQEAGAILACAFRQKLLEPHSQGGNRPWNEEGYLVAFMVPCQLA